MKESIARTGGDAKTRQLLETVLEIHKTVVDEFYELRPYIREALFFPNKGNDKRVADIMKMAKQTLDVCIFAFTNDVLRDALLFAHYR